MLYLTLAIGLVVFLRRAALFGPLAFSSIWADFLAFCRRLR